MQMTAGAARLEHGRSQRLAVKEAAEVAAAAQQAANRQAIQAEEDAARQTALEAQLLHHRCLASSLTSWHAQAPNPGTLLRPLLLGQMHTASKHFKKLHQSRIHQGNYVHHQA